MQVRTEDDLGVLIRVRRKELGLDQATLAAWVGVSRQWLVEVEKGKPRAEIGLVLRTLRVLGIELSGNVAGQLPTQGISPTGLIDIDSVIEGARHDRRTK